MARPYELPVRDWCDPMVRDLVHEPGWTMASALIAYQTRKLRAQKKRREADGDAARGEATADGDGRGLVVFDLETTQMIEGGVDMEEMEISCAMRACCRGLYNSLFAVEIAVEVLQPNAQGWP